MNIILCVCKLHFMIDSSIDTWYSGFIHVWNFVCFQADNIMLKDRKLNIAPAIKKQVSDVGYIKVRTILLLLITVKSLFYLSLMKIFHTLWFSIGVVYLDDIHYFVHVGNGRCDLQEGPFTNKQTYTVP